LYLPEVKPPPPIPAIALAAIKLFILGANAQKAVPNAGSQYGRSAETGRGLTEEGKGHEQGVFPSYNITQSAVYGCKAAD
jgi:hypothetical protein